MQIQKRSNRNRLIAAAIILIAANVLFFITMWLLNTYDQIHIDQFIYHEKTSSEGAARSLEGRSIIYVGSRTILLTAAEMVLYALIHRLRGNRQPRKCYAPLLAIALLAASCGVFLAETGAVTYVYSMIASSDFIEEHYVDPATASLTFPEEKRNLIYIYLESMESTYGETDAGAPITADYIPELTALAAEHTHFSNDTGLGGALSYDGTVYTASALVAQTAGITVKTPLLAENFGGDNPYMPGATSIGDILDAHGYRQVLMMGSDCGFANKKSYFTEHGNYEIIDIEALKVSGKLPEDYLVFWGFEDQKLFSFAQETLTELGQGDEPFNFTMLTVDTHFPDGYDCEQCEDIYNEQYANVLSCSSRRINAFIEWIMAQPFYENTTIVISGDHLTMDPYFLDGIDDDYVRTLYNCIINPAVEPLCETNRQFGSFDMLPTTLSAMGVKIDGDRLALGTNLFSGKATLTEEYGYDYLNAELMKRSEYYNTHILQMK